MNLRGRYGQHSFHGHEAPTYGRGGFVPIDHKTHWGLSWKPHFEIVGEDTRGQYGAHVGLDASDVFNVAAGPFGTAAAKTAFTHEVSDEELRVATATANAAVAPLVEQRGQLLREWRPDKLLSHDQLTAIMKSALEAAHACESNLVAMIDKVPAHWEGPLRNDLKVLREALSATPLFDGIIANLKAPTIVPGFRTWIDHLLSRVEDGATTITAISSIIPDWVFMRDLLASLHRAALATIRGIISLAEDAKKILQDGVGKYLLIGVAAIGGVAALGLAIRSATKK